MKIILVRHGHPDYANDCLTPLGHEQAEKAALRLKNESIRQIFSSPFGRSKSGAYTLHGGLLAVDFLWGMS